MRARLRRQSETRSRIARPRRDDHLRTEVETDFDLGPVEQAPAEASSPTSRDLRAERRLRASGGPEDRAQYSCQCGYSFEAAVTTSVSCPNCGSGQAW